MGTEKEDYEYRADYELADDVPSTESDLTVPEENTEDEDDEETDVYAVNSVPLSEWTMSMKPLYYLNKNNTGDIYNYNKKGKIINSKTLNNTYFSLNDDYNAEYLMKKLLAFKNTKKSVFLLAADSTYDKAKVGSYNFVIVNRINGNGESEALVRFSGNGGSIDFDNIMTHQGGILTETPAVKRKGYSFMGWYTKRSGGKQVQTGDKLSQSTTLYAHWKKVTVEKGKIVSGTVTADKNYKLIYKQTADADGYQLQYSQSQNFISSKTNTVVIKNKLRTQYKVSGLSPGKCYYFRIRAYQKDSTGSKIYGKWSAVQKAKIN